MIDQDNAADRKRSPTYPYLNLGEAVEILEHFVQQHRFTKVPLHIALKEAGYSITSGSGARVTASLTAFGLFEIEGTRDNRRIWPSRIGQAIAWENPNDPSERLRAIQEAALKPEMHQWMYTHYSLDREPLPQPNVLQYDLKMQLGFQDKAVDAFIKEFKETYEYAALGNPTYLTEEVLEVPQIPNSEPPAVSPKQETANPTQVSSDTDELTTRLTNKRIARLIIPKEMNGTDFQLLAQWLEQLKLASLYEADERNQNRNSPPAEG